MTKRGALGNTLVIFPESFCLETYDLLFQTPSILKALFSLVSPDDCGNNPTTIFEIPMFQNDNPYRIINRLIITQFKIII